MDVTTLAEPDLSEARRERELVQWLTCTACAVAWVGRWSEDSCWHCGRTEHVALRWSTAA
ncbi:MAG TPA: hypothetical protein VFT68_01470 [Lapillicoccus sp.]|nr:hypothetical protein [Lapillicoccus sp.]